MAHDHHHEHHHGDSAGAYFTEQLLTILVCGLFGYAAVQLYRTGMLDKTLVPEFHPWVLAGGVVILLLVAVRAVGVWNEAGELRERAASAECAADHAHGPDCDHDHDHAHHHHSGDETDLDHDHGHSHDTSWVFARMLVLVFPVCLFFLGLPDAALSREAQEAELGHEAALGAGGLRKDVAAKGGTVLRFNDLNDAAFDEAKRQSMEGQTATLEGRFNRLGDKEFTLYRMKMSCCVTDTVMLKVRIVVPQALTGYNNFDWVKVKGQIQFVQVPGGRAGAERYIPVIVVGDITDVQKGTPKNEYEL